MAEAKPPSRVLLIVAGALTQLIGLVCMVLALASLPVVHDLHRGMQSLVASVIAAMAAIVCGTLAWRGRLVPLALCAGVDVGFGIVMPRGGSALGSIFRILPADDAQLAETVVTAAAVFMFVTAILCVLAIPSAIKLQRWARDQIAQSGGDLPAEEWKPSQTLRGLGQAKVFPTQIVNVATPRKDRVWVIGGVAVTAVALGVVVITAISGRSGGPRASDLGPRPAGSGSAGSGSAAPKPAVVAVAPDAATGDAPAIVSDPSPDDLVTAFHAALAHMKKDELAPLLDAKVFAFGVDAHEIAEGKDAVLAQLRADVGEAGGEVTSKFRSLGHDADVAWLAEELRIGNKTFVVTVIAGLHDHVWTIAALHWAVALPNETAYKTARDGTLAVPDAIPSARDDSPLATAMRTAFASKPSFVEARSVRVDAFNFGSAPGERIAGGDAIKKTFARIRAVVHLHDAVRVGTIGERGGWGAANVDFTDADRDGTQVTQTFRVLAAWVKEDAGWRIVQTQWSNPQ